MKFIKLITLLLLSGAISALIACGGGSSIAGLPASHAASSADPGYVIRAENYDANDSIIGYAVHFYNAGHQLMALENYAANGTRTSYANYTYNAARQLMRVDRHSATGLPTGYDLYAYGSNGTVRITIIQNYVYVGDALIGSNTDEEIRHPPQGNPPAIRTGYSRLYAATRGASIKEIYDAADVRRDRCVLAISYSAQDLPVQQTETCMTSQSITHYANGLPETATFYERTDGAWIRIGYARYMRDQDNDGIGDAHDNCWTVANPDQHNSDTDDLGDACDGDDDNDGVADYRPGGAPLDNCRIIANPSQANHYGTSAGDACEDVDADGHLDLSDNCPTRANPAQVDSDGDDLGDLCDPDTISTAADLQLIRDEPNGSYTLVRNLNHTGLDWRAVNFYGQFNGSGYTITGLTAPLFDRISANATVTHLGILGGILAKRNDGRITHSYATGDSHAAGHNGGLVGENHGLITHSYATGRSVATDRYMYSGGLVGLNTGAITHSYATGASTCDGLLCYSGGLVGFNGGEASDERIIHRSYATGNSTCSDPTCTSGGLVGFNERGTISHSYAVGSLVGRNIHGPIIASYNGTLPQLQCPVRPGDRSCDPRSYYAGWDRTIWDFGDPRTLPSIKNLPACPAAFPYCRHYGTTVDRDNDSRIDARDNCPTAPNPQQADADEDKFGDVCDGDDDNDGIADYHHNGTVRDNCRVIFNPRQFNNDSDELGDACDPDDDNDSIADGADNCPIASNPKQFNNDTDELGDVCDPDDDNDGIADYHHNGTARDNCRFTPNPDQFNNDTDGLGDACDPDDDNDRIADGADNCPLVSNLLQFNNDTDELGDVCDPDDDNDGIADYDARGAVRDNCRFTPNPDQFNNDTDGLGDACDPDDDNDGIADYDTKGEVQDNCRLTPNPDQFNNDTDGLGDACDPDDDNDGIADYYANGAVRDNCRTIPNPDQANNYGARAGDACDDSDQDGWYDNADNCPTTINPDQSDTDRDQEGDACDPDTVIANATTLERLPKNGARGAYRVTTSITVRTPWTSITNFRGTFNGDNHTISGLTAPLFGSIAAAATVTRIGILNSTLAHRNDGHISHVYATGNSTCISTDCYSGGLVGRNAGTIAHSHATGRSETEGSYSGRRSFSYNGGLVGYNEGVILHSYANGSSSSINRGTVPQASFSGGLVGYNKGVIIHSYANGSSSSLNRGYAVQIGFSGGLVGYNEGNITNSHAKGASVCSTTSCTAGGLVGSNQGAVLLSYAAGNSTCRGLYCRSAGLVGFSSGAINHSYALGDSSCDQYSCKSGGLVGYSTDASIVHASYAIGNSRCDHGDCESGGLIGYNSGTITDSYATGNSHSSWGTSGGLVGDNSGTITRSYAIGRGTGSYDTYYGGLVGNNYRTNRIRASYRVQNVGRTLGGEHRTLGQLRCPTSPGDSSCVPTTYTGWDNAIWDFGDNETLPTLMHLPSCPPLRPHCRW